MATKKGKKVRVFNSNYKRLPLIFFLYIALCLISTPSSTWAAYIYTKLLPPGWSQVYAESINDKGEVVGWGQAGTMQKGFLYSRGVYTELLPPGWALAWARRINDKGDVIGEGYDVPIFEGTIWKGFLYSRGVYTELLPPDYDLAYPTGINDKGDVIGWADLIGVGTDCFIATPFRGE